MRPASGAWRYASPAGCFIASICRSPSDREGCGVAGTHALVGDPRLACPVSSDANDVGVIIKMVPVVVEKMSPRWRPDGQRACPIGGTADQHLQARSVGVDHHDSKVTDVWVSLKGDFVAGG